MLAHVGRLVRHLGKRCRDHLQIFLGQFDLISFLRRKLIDQIAKHEVQIAVNEESENEADEKVLPFIDSRRSRLGLSAAYSFWDFHNLAVRYRFCAKGRLVFGVFHRAEFGLRNLSFTCACA